MFLFDNEAQCFFASVFFGSFSTQNQQTSWSSSEWVWLSRLARLWAYTRQVTSTDVWIWIIWHCWMLQVLLHSFTSGIHTVPVAKGTNGERHWWLLLSRASPYRDMGFFCFSMREDTCRIRCSGTLCISQGNLDGENFFFVAVCWMFFLGCFFRRNPDVAFCFNGRPTTAENPWRFRCIPVPQHCDGVQELLSKVMKWWNQKCPTKTGVVFFRVGTFHDPRTGRLSSNISPR